MSLVGSADKPISRIVGTWPNVRSPSSILAPTSVHRGSPISFRLPTTRLNNGLSRPCSERGSPSTGRPRTTLRLLARLRSLSALAGDMLRRCAIAMSSTTKRIVGRMPWTWRHSPATPGPLPTARYNSRSSGVESLHSECCRVWSGRSRGFRTVNRRAGCLLGSWPASEECEGGWEPMASTTRSGKMQISRREFVKSATASGIALSVSRLAMAEEPGFAARETLPGRQAWNPAATGVGRIDGVAKVTGAKLYASDFRAADLPGWPQNTAHAMFILAPDATHVYTGMDRSRLSGALKPAVVVTAADLARIGTRVPEFYAGDLFCPVGTTPLYLGQPVALLIFEQFDAFDQARLALRDGTFVKFGEETGPIRAPDYGAFRFTRVAGPTSDAPDVYSTFKDGLVSPGQLQNTELPVWSPLAMLKAQPYTKAATYGEQIRAELAASNPALLVLDREFENPSNDCMFLEPECGIAWYDSGRK